MQEIRVTPRRLLDRVNLLDALVVSGIALIAAVVRALSVNYPLSVGEFDPWYILYNSILISNAHGNWYAVPPDVHAWYPWGFFIELGNTLGLPLIVSLLSLPFYSTFGANAVYTVSLFLDFALEAFAVLAAFLATSRLTNRVGGYVGALLIATSPSLTGKNLVGGMPKPTWGGMLILFALYFLYEAIERRKAILGVPAGIMIFLADITWGGDVYIALTLGGAAILMVFLGKNSEAAANALTVAAVTSGVLASISPNSIGFLSGTTHGLGLLIISLILYLEIYVRRIMPKELSEAVPIMIAAVALAVVGVALIGLIVLTKSSVIPSRYFAIINPFYQVTVPIDVTVAEYIPQSINGLFTEFGTALLLFIPGIYYLLKKADLPSLWLLVLGIVALYGTSAQPYLYNYTAIVAAAVGGVGAGYIFERIVSFKSQIRSKVLMGTLFMGIVVISLAADAALTVAESNAPNPIITSSSPYTIPNYSWLSAINWIRQNTPTNSVIFSWWDYGYWIEVIGNRTVIDENNTLNGTQIKLMAEMFLNNESFAANVLEKYYHLYPYGSPNYTRPVYFVAYDAYTLVINGTRTVAYLGYPPNLGGTFLGITTSFGDINKALGAMVTIARYNESQYVNFTYVENLVKTIESIVNTSPSFASNAQALLNQISQGATFAWTLKAYNSLIIQMFIEALQSQGYTVAKPFTDPSQAFSSQNQVPDVIMEYFQPVYVSQQAFPLTVPMGQGAYYVSGIITVVYQFVQPGHLVQPVPGAEL